MSVVRVHLLIWHFSKLEYNAVNLRNPTCSSVSLFLCLLRCFSIVQQPCNVHSALHVLNYTNYDQLLTSWLPDCNKLSRQFLSYCMRHISYNILQSYFIATYTNYYSVRLLCPRVAHPCTLRIHYRPLSTMSNVEPSPDCSRSLVSISKNSQQNIDTIQSLKLIKIQVFHVWIYY